LLKGLHLIKGQVSNGIRGASGKEFMIKEELSTPGSLFTVMA
jgi:hypothetical protein